MPPLLLQGIVTKVGCMNKTATVSVARWAVHPRTKKRLERVKKYLTHDPQNQLRLADEVTIQNCPPISARKRFQLYKVLKSPEAEREDRHKREALEIAAAKAATGSLLSQPGSSAASEQNTRV